MDGVCLIAFVGAGGSGKSTTARLLQTKLENSVLLSITEPAIDALSVVVGTDARNFKEPFVKRSLMAVVNDEETSYEQALADFYVSQRISLGDAVWVANLLQRAAAARKQNPALAFVILDDVVFRDELDGLETRFAKRFVVFCDGDPAGLQEQSGAFVKDLTYNDCAVADEEIGARLSTDAGDVEQQVQYVVKCLRKKGLVAAA